MIYFWEMEVWRWCHYSVKRDCRCVGGARFFGVFSSVSHLSSSSSSSSVTFTIYVTQKRQGLKYSEKLRTQNMLCVRNIVRSYCMVLPYRDGSATRTSKRDWWTSTLKKSNE